MENHSKPVNGQGIIPFRQKLKKNANHIVDFIRSMSTYGTKHHGTFLKNLDTFKSLHCSMRTEGSTATNDNLEPLIEFGLQTIESELEFRAKKLEQNLDYNPRRWELPYYVMRLFVSLFDNVCTIHEFVPLQRSQIELNRAKIAEKLFGRLLVKMHSFALEIMNWIELEQQQVPLITNVLMESIKILRISSFELDISEPFRCSIFELICKYDASEERLWRLETLKYFSCCSVMSLLVRPDDRNQSDYGDSNVELTYNVHDSPRNRLIAFYEWSLSFGCPKPLEAKRLSVQNLLEVIDSDQDGRRVAVALELVSYVELASQGLNPDLKSAIEQLNLTTQFFSIRLINLLDHDSEMVRARAAQLLINWYLAQQSPYSFAHRCVHSAITKRLINESSPIVRLQFLTMIHAILIERHEDTKAKRRTYKSSLVQMIAYECIRTLELVPSSDRSIRLIRDLFCQFQNKINPISEGLVGDLVTLIEFEVQNGYQVGHNVASSFLEFILEFTLSEQFKRFSSSSKLKLRVLKLTRILSKQHNQLDLVRNRLQESLTLRKKNPPANVIRQAPSTPLLAGSRRPIANPKAEPEVNNHNTGYLASNEHFATQVADL